MFSPRTRGWSPGHRRPARFRRVVPAHAGLVPASRPPTTSWPGSPRARGAGPWAPGVLAAVFNVLPAHACPRRAAAATRTGVAATAVTARTAARPRSSCQPAEHAHPLRVAEQRHRHRLQRAVTSKLGQGRRDHVDPPRGRAHQGMAWAISCSPDMEEFGHVRMPEGDGLRSLKPRVTNPLGWGYSTKISIDGTGERATDRTENTVSPGRFTGQQVSSPRRRGWSWRRQRREHPGMSSPRGGAGPAAFDQAKTMDKSSPHRRGSSRDACGRVISSGSSPRKRGWSPQVDALGDVSPVVPRTRGVGPDAPMAAPTKPRSSPRTRG